MTWKIFQSFYHFRQGFLSSLSFALACLYHLNLPYMFFAISCNSKLPRTFSFCTARSPPGILISIPLASMQFSYPCVIKNSIYFSTNRETTSNNILLCTLNFSPVSFHKAILSFLISNNILLFIVEILRIHVAPLS